MAEYARVQDGKVAEIVNIDPAIHNAWVLSGNPKAAAYRPLTRRPSPTYNTSTHTAEETFQIYATTVFTDWVVRPKTADERRRSWTPLQFLERFTDHELDTIETRRATDPLVQKFYRTASFAQEVVSDDPRTVAGLDYLTAIGILTAARKDAIINGA